MTSLSKYNLDITTPCVWWEKIGVPPYFMYKAEDEQNLHIIIISVIKHSIQNYELHNFRFIMYLSRS